MTVVDKKNELEEDLKDIENRRKTPIYKGYTQPIPVSFKLGKYTKQPKPFTYGLDEFASRGLAITRAEFMEMGCMRLAEGRDRRQKMALEEDLRHSLF